jgi:two-component system, NtrC family, sensor kinase
VRTHKILIADDSGIEAERIRRTLEQLPGVSTTVVEDGAAAVREAKRTRYDLLLVDYEMPSLNGLQVVRLLRGTWSRLELPILMLTVHDDVQTKVHSLRQGANDYVTKPVEPEELLARVQAHLDLRIAVEENIKARMQILEGRKLETIGRLSAGLAHELNTPAQFTADNLAFLQKVQSESAELLEKTRLQVARLEHDAHPWAVDFLEFWKERQLSYLLAEAPKALEECSSGVMRMVRIVRELKEFAGEPEKDWGISDINRAIENTAYVSRQLWSSVAQVTFRLDPKLPNVVCDVTALKQAFFNILMTLVENVERGGAVPRQLAQIDIETLQAEEVEIRFSGRGPGFRAVPAAVPEDLGSADTFGGGADHQLAVAHSVVVGQHHGKLTFESQPGEYVAFVVRLPELQPSASHPKLVPGFGTGSY